MQSFWSCSSDLRFQHPWYEFEKEVVQVNPEVGRRYYQVDDKKFPSVTSVLGSFPNEAIEQWKKNVGEEEAKRVSKRATDRGSFLHSNVEEYLLNHTVHIDKKRIIDIQMFKSMIPLLNRIQNIRILEDAVYSNTFMTAGTVDCVAEFDGVLSIIDFKTSNHIKSKEDISTYWTQTSVYSYAIEEMGLDRIENLVILMSVENSQPLLFQDKRQNWSKELMEFQKQAKRLYSELN